MSAIILLAETGSDITPERANARNIRLVPMHVSLGDVTLDDGSFPPEDIHAYYERTGKTPTTSGSTPYMEEAIRTVLDQEASALGYKKITWMKTGCVITCHGGPGAFGIVGTTA